MSDYPKEGQRDPVALMAMALLALCLVLGGASQKNELQLAVLELAALPVLFLAGRQLWATGAYRHAPLALTLAALAVAVPLLQLLPLPYEVWSTLPGRQDVVVAVGLLGTKPWLPASLTPEATWRSVLALLPPLAVFAATMAVSPTQRRQLVAVVLVAAAANVVLGAVQLASGGNPAIYLYDPTNLGSAVGFFSNRNHLASLLLISLPLAGVFVGTAVRQAHVDRRLQVALAAVFALIAIVAIAATRSRAGVLLAGPALIAALAVAWSASTSIGRKWGVLALGLVGAAAVGAVATFSLSPLIARFDRDVGAEQRFEAWPIVVAAADTYLPVGSGIGSFDPVFRAVEPVETLDETYFNHAHNDYLEIWLEAGWLGAFGFALFVLWWGRRSYYAWVSTGSYMGLERAASFGIGLVLLHALADYPLRTEAVGAVFALACSMLASKEEPDGSRVICSNTSRASTIPADCTQPWATSALPRPSAERHNPVHFFGGRSDHRL